MISSITLQSQLSRHLRNPEVHSAPAGVEERRLQIYRDLIYNNIEGFIASGFPILRKIYADADWHAMVRDFIDRHESHSPYFLHIGAEFIDYLREERELQIADPPFLLELAQYEWAELALFVSDEELPPVEKTVDPDFMQAIPCLSPLAWSMVFEYPVHQIGREFQPKEPADSPVCLVVYRDREDRVGFLEANPLTARLLELCEENRTKTSILLLQQIAAEIPSADSGQIAEGGQAALVQLRNLDIIQFMPQG